MRDPRRLIAMKALRVAVVVPGVYLILQFVLGWDAAALSAAFASFSMLVFADFGGPKWDQFRANAALGLAGVVLLVVGSLTTRYAWLALVATLIVVFVVAYAAVLRGYFAASTAAAILPWVLGATSVFDLDAISAHAAGWAIGAAAAALAAMLLWPSHPRSAIRSALADVLDACGSATGSLTTPANRDQRHKRIADALAQLRNVYDGRIVRPGGGTARDRSLLLAIDEVSRLAMVLRWDDLDPAQLGPEDQDLMLVSATVLATCARAMRGEGSVPRAHQLDEMRIRQARGLADWCDDELAANRPLAIRPRVDASAHISIVALMAEQVAVFVSHAKDPVSGKRGSAHATPQEVSPARSVAPHDSKVSIAFSHDRILDPTKRITPARVLLQQWRWDSPWLRTAMRTAIAITATVAVVEVIGAQHGFWISLGALVALKFDSTGTMRSAAQVLVGTCVGFLLGALLVTAFDGDGFVLFITLPVLAFLAAYTPGAVSLTVGQAAFTLFVIDLVGSTASDRLGVAQWRLGDVMVGLTISLLVSVLMWPHGVAPTVKRSIATAIGAAEAFLLVAYQQFGKAGPTLEQVRRARVISATDGAQAAESFDLAYSQGGPGLATAPVSVAQLNTAQQLDRAAQIVSRLPQEATVGPEFAGTQTAMVAAAAAMSRNREELPSLITALDRAVDADLVAIAEREASGSAQKPECGRAVVVVLVAAVWLTHAAQLVDRSARLAGAAAQQSATNETADMGNEPDERGIATG